MTITANHAHVGPRESTNRYLAERGHPELLIELMDACEIDRCVAFAPFAEFLEGTGIDPNTWLAEQVAPHSGRLIPFGTINPKRADAVTELERIRALGFKGVKMHPAVQEFAVAAPELDEFYAAAQELGLILDFHTGVHRYPIFDFHPLQFDGVALRHPRLRMVLEHMGGRSFFHDAVAVIQNDRLNPQGRVLYAGLTSVFHREAHRVWYMGPERIDELVWQIGEDHIIFGLDFPYNDLALTQHALTMIRELSLPESVKAKILGNNLNRLLQTTV